MIVNTTLACDGRKCNEYLHMLRDRYPFLQLERIGTSLFGTPILAAKVGGGERSCLMVGTHHGLEWITGLLLLRFLEELCHHAQTHTEWLHYAPDYLLETRTGWIVPMLNPDGVEIALGRLRAEHYRAVTAMCPFAELPYRWQANGRGVDLNHNYDAGWQEGKEQEKEYGIIGPGPTRYGGTAPESEPETAALTAFIRGVHPSLLLAYHAQGEVIYHRYRGGAPERGEQLAELFARLTGYALEDTRGMAGGRGCKDWFIDEFGRPGFTIEVGKGKNPLPLTDFDEIYRRNTEMMLMALLLA